MSEIPLKKDNPPSPGNSASGPYGVAGDSPGASFGGGTVVPTAKIPSPPQVKVIIPALGAGRVLCGAILLVLGGLLAVLPQELWVKWLSTTHPLLREQAARWIAVGLVAIFGLIVARVQLLHFLSSAALLILALHCIDKLLGDRLTTILEALLPQGIMAWQCFFIFCLLLACLLHAGRPGSALHSRSIVGCALVAVAALAAVKGWYQLEKVTPYLGAPATEFAMRWKQETIWFIMLILVAIGLSFCRIPLAHFLNALVLLALAVHVVNTGYVELRQFPGLSAAAGTPIAIEESSYKNVESYQWAIASTLVLISAFYLYLSMGTGGLCIAFAVAWLAGGLAISQVVGTMSVVRGGYDALGGKSSFNVLGNMGLPTDPAYRFSREDLNRPVVAPQERDAVTLEIIREVSIREVTPFLWILLTALFAGIVAATGFRILMPDPVHRYWLGLAVMMVFGVSLVLLVMVWPKNPAQSWTNWLAAFKLSRYHAHAIWVVFLGAMGIAAAFAMQPGSNAAFWINLSIGFIFVGTMATLFAAAILIHFGNFPKLPAWTYLVIAVAQSSLAWVLMMHGSHFPRTPRARAITK